jgi:hypothetical protein
MCLAMKLSISFTGILYLLLTSMAEIDPFLIALRIVGGATANATAASDTVIRRLLNGVSSGLVSFTVHPPF